MTEYWLVDARGPELLFAIHRRGEDGFEPVATDADGYQPSQVFQCSFRLDWTLGPLGERSFEPREQG